MSLIILNYPPQATASMDATNVDNSRYHAQPYSKKSLKQQTYQTNSTFGMAHNAVISANVLHSPARNPISGNIIRPTVQNTKYPIPIREWYFSVVNSVNKEKAEEFSRPIIKRSVNT